jgi:hypothetical protein
MEGKQQWLAEPLPVVSKMPQSGSRSGLSTPRSSAVMQVSDFELIRPISRGAYGRVYLVRKLSTGEGSGLWVEGNHGSGVEGWGTEELQGSRVQGRVYLVKMTSIGGCLALHASTCTAYSPLRAA